MLKVGVVVEDDGGDGGGGTEGRRKLCSGLQQRKERRDYVRHGVTVA